MSHQMACNGRVEIAYECFGSAKDPAVILISGAGAPAEFWPISFCDSLAQQRYFVIRYWHRDTGFSTHFDSSYPISELLDDLMTVMAAADIAEAHLVGHSMGGYLAQLAMVTHPRRVLSACGISAGPTGDPELQKQLGLSQPDDALWPLLLANQPDGHFATDWPGWRNSWEALHGQVAIDEPIARAYTEALYVGPDSNWQVADNHIHAMTTVTDTLVKALPASAIPLLMLHGSHDPLVPPDHGQCSAELARHGRFQALDGAGHMFFASSIWTGITQAVIEHCGKAQ